MSPRSIQLLAHGSGHHDFDAMEMFGTFCLRIAETIVVASPTVFAGLLLAGILQAIVVPARLRRLIGDHPVLGPLKMALFTLFVPVCAFGVIPAAQAVRRAGVRPAAIVTFLISAPMLNVLWTSYGFSATDPWLWAATVAASIVAAISPILATMSTISRSRIRSRAAFASSPAIAAPASRASSRASPQPPSRRSRRLPTS